MVVWATVGRRSFPDKMFIDIYIYSEGASLVVSLNIVAEHLDSKITSSELKRKIILNNTIITVSYKDNSQSDIKIDRNLSWWRSVCTEH